MTKLPVMDFKIAGSDFPTQSFSSDFYLDFAKK